MNESMRKFLYSRWFFLFLALVCLIDVGVDSIAARYGSRFLLTISFVPNLVAAGMAVWMFLDLHRRRPRKDGDHSGS
jgi:hypothetical protein